MTSLIEGIEFFFKGPGAPIQSVVRESAVFVFEIDGRPYSCHKKSGKIEVKEGKPEDYMFSIACQKEAFEEIMRCRDYAEFRSKWKDLRIKGAVKLSFLGSGASFIKKWTLLGMFEALRRFGFYA